MGLFRSYDWTFHRNANMVVPIYLGAFMACWGYGQSNFRRERVSPFRPELAVLSSVGLFILMGTHHYPWSALGDLTKGRSYRESREAVRQETRSVWDRIREFVPADASVAFRVEAGLEAVIANRQKAWAVGYNPEGVEYYVIQTEPIVFIAKDFPDWQNRLRKIENDKGFEPLYRDYRLAIYKNLHPAPIPRREDILGWDILWRAIVPGR